MADEYQKKGGYGKKPLWMWILIYVIVAAIVYAAVYFIFFAKNGSGYGATTTQNITSQKVKFSDTANSRYAYLISINNYDDSTKTALSGFKVDRKVLADGTQQITLTAQKPGYQDQSYTVKPGQKLYFIEQFLGDDTNGQEGNTMDDKAVLVDADGYVVP